MKATLLRGILALASAGSAATGGSPSAQSGSGARFEFRGWVVEAEVRIFNVYDAAEGRSWWLELDQSNGSVAVRRYDDATESIVVETGSTSFSLVLKRARIGLSASSGVGVSVDPTNADSRVSTALEQEIRRRRAQLEMVRQLVADETVDG